MQTCAHATFKGLLAWRYVQREDQSGSWFATFAPIYASIGVQLALHLRKIPGSRGKRPGLPMSMLGLLGLLVSFKLAGALSYEDASWSNVLWPLWVAVCCVGTALVLGLCCGVPLILRSR